MDGWIELDGSEQQGLTRRFRWTAVASTAASASSSLVLHSLACLVAFAARAAAASRVPVPSIGLCACAPRSSLASSAPSIHPSIHPASRITMAANQQPTLQPTEPPTPIEYCDPVPNALKCPVCNDAFVDAVMCTLCKPPTTLCRQCLARQLDKCIRCNNILSHDRREIFDNPIVTEMADGLRVRCRHRVDGCDWQGERRRLSEHCEIECNKRPSVCIHCGRCRSLEWLSRHQDHCGHRLVRCEQCGRDDVQARCVDHHKRRVCGRRSVEAELDEMKEILARLQARDAGLAAVILEITTQIKAEARALEISKAEEAAGRGNLDWEVVRVIGSQGAADGQFNGPIGVAIDHEGHIIVSDNGNHRVQVMSHDGAVISKLGFLGSGNGQFNSPRGVAIDNEGHIVVADYGNNRVQVMSRDGKMISKLGSEGSGDGQFNNPSGVAIDHDGHIIVADQSNHRVQVMSRDGKMISEFGSEGSEDGQFKYPSGVAIDREGHIIVADTFNNRVQVMSRDGTMISKLGSEGSGDGQFNHPIGVAIDREGHIIVADTNNHRVQVMSRDGKMISEFGSEGSGDGQFMNPWGVAIDHDGHIVVLDSDNHRVQVIRMPWIDD